MKNDIVKSRYIMVNEKCKTFYKSTLKVKKKKNTFLKDKQIDDYPNGSGRSGKILKRF